MAIRTIAVQLGVAKSSVSVWVRDVPVPPEAPYWATAARRVTRPPDAAPVRRLPVWNTGEVQTCSRCRLLLPHESFNRLREGRQFSCRDCFHAYYREHRGVMRPRWDETTRSRQDRARGAVLSLLGRTPCQDCGEADPVVLEFDHVGPKRGHVADLAGRGRSAAFLEEELLACEVVCVNCHRRRTAARADWDRAAPDWRERIAGRQPAVRRALELVYCHLEAAGCTDCGLQDLTVLDFDHVGPKRFTVPRAARLGTPLRELRAEIAVCEVRCGNCHRRVTAARGGWFRAVAG